MSPRSLFPNRYPAAAPDWRRRIFSINSLSWSVIYHCRWTSKFLCKFYIAYTAAYFLGFASQTAIGILVCIVLVIALEIVRLVTILRYSKLIFDPTDVFADDPAEEAAMERASSLLR